MQKRTKLFIIAGPQSSGKTSILAYLKKKFPHFFFIDETNQYSLIGKNHPGGAFVTRETEEAIAETDILKIKNIDQNIPCAVIETGIMHCSYHENFMSKSAAEKYFQAYIKAFNRLTPYLIYLDTKPHVSWQRRRPKYLERIAKAGVTDPSRKKEMLTKYRKNIETLYPLWTKYYGKVPFQKYFIKNSYTDWEKCKRKVKQIILSHVGGEN